MGVMSRMVERTGALFVVGEGFEGCLAITVSHVGCSIAGGGGNAWVKPGGGPAWTLGG